MRLWHVHVELAGKFTASPVVVAETELKAEMQVKRFFTDHDIPITSIKARPLEQLDGPDGKVYEVTLVLKEEPNAE